VKELIYFPSNAIRYTIGTSKGHVSSQFENGDKLSQFWARLE